MIQVARPASTEVHFSPEGHHDYPHPSPTHPRTPRYRPSARLLGQLRRAAQQRGHPSQTVTAFTDWARRFILFQQLLGHESLETTRIYTQVARQGGVAGVASPLDLLHDATAEKVQADLDATRLLGDRP